MSKSDFKISIAPNYANIQTIFIFCFSITMASLTLAFFVYLRLQTWSLLWPIVVTLLSASFIALYFAFWTLRVLLYSPVALVIDSNGIVDCSSFFKVGFIPFEDIRRLRLVYILGCEVIEVRLRSHSKSSHHIRARLGWLYIFHRWFFGSKLFIPMAFVATSRFDLESRLIHLSKDTTEPIAETVTIDENIEEPPPLPVNQQQPFELLFTDKEENAFQIFPDDNTIIRRVKAIKAKVSKSHLDKNICELYFDEVRHYPKWSQMKDPRLPPKITNIQGTTENSAYEEVQFTCDHERFRMGLRKDIEEQGTAALLSIGVNDQVVLSLKVRVEIGALDPMDIEQFLEGPWLITINGLIEAKKSKRKQLNSLRSPVEEKGRAEQPSSEELEKLKNRFGLK